MVTEKIKEVILGGKYKPGDRLPSEREFIEQLQVSRIVVREAFRKLEANGLITQYRTPAEFADEIKERWAILPKLLDELGLRQK